jgi:hypothetical protein
MYSDIYI